LVVTDCLPSRERIIPWFKDIWQQMITYTEKDHIHSTFLFIGPPGIGKQAFVMEYASYILCTERGEYSCGYCRSCALFKVGNHPDFFKIEAEGKNKTIKIEQIRGLIDTLSHTAMLSGYQVAVILLAEHMTKSAANALLKTLEEPRGKVLLLLTTHQPHYLAATLRSRCFSVKLPLPHRTQVLEWLGPKLSSKEEALAYLCLSDNRPFKALDFALKNYLQALNVMIQNLLAIKKGTTDPIVVAASCLTEPEEQLQLLLFILFDMIRIKSSATQFLLNSTNLALCKELCACITVNKLFEFLDIISRAKQLIANHSNVNLQLLMEQLFIEWRYKLCV
jgi:DNA polymerase-3 subunit delta'